MQLYNIVVELDAHIDKLTSTQVDAMINALTDYHPAIGRGVFGQAEVTISVPAEGLRQAMSTALAILADALPGRAVTTFAALTADEFDRRAALDSFGDLVTVTEAAELLGQTRQRVLQRIDEGTLPARRVGKAGWVLPRAAIDRELALWGDA